MKVKVIKKEEREQRQRAIRPMVERKLLLDEKSRLMQRVKQIDRRLQEAGA
jgi:hypothetical protein